MRRRKPTSSRPGREHGSTGRADDLEPAVITLLVIYGLAILGANLALMTGL